MAGLLQDLRYALRQMRKRPGFAFAVVATLALGIGAGTAMFSVIHAVLLEPLGYLDPDRVVLISDGATPIRFDELLRASRSYTEIRAFAGGLPAHRAAQSDPMEALRCE
jgi:putative ABC transport system permease protein